MSDIARGALRLVLRAQVKHSEIQSFPLVVIRRTSPLTASHLRSTAGPLSLA